MSLRRPKLSTTKGSSAPRRRRRRQVIWHEHVGESYKLNKINIFVKQRQICVLWRILSKWNRYTHMFHSSKMDRKISTSFSVVTECHRTCRTSLSLCMSWLLWANKQNRYGEDQVAGAAEEGDMVKFIKHHANVQTTCGFRTNNQLILVLARDARLVGKRFPWVTGHVFWRHEASAQRRTF